MSAREVLELVKIRIVLLVTLTAAGGYVLGGGDRGSAEWPLLVAGMVFVTAGACAANMVLERRTDALMRRTEARPLPSRRVSSRAATLVAATATFVGALLLLACRRETFALGGLAWSLYVLVYTPLKSVTSLNTIVGAVPGALPPLIGWSASGATIGAFAWVLFWIMFAWQIPHFLALAWIYREDYARGGMKMLPGEENGAARAGRQALVYAAALVPLSLAPAALLGTTSPWILAGVALSVVFAGFAARFARRQERATAASLFGFSLFYLPTLFVLFLFAR